MSDTHAYNVQICLKRGQVITTIIHTDDIDQVVSSMHASSVTKTVGYTESGAEMRITLFREDISAIVTAARPHVPHD